MLADQNYLSEALYNLLINAWEANVAVGHGDRAVELVSHKERLYTVLEVRDDGCGMTKAEQKKIFEPFYSSKNSNTSWGMGLYHCLLYTSSTAAARRRSSTHRLPAQSVRLRKSRTLTAFWRQSAARAG